MTECSPVSSLANGNLAKLYLGYAQIHYKLKTNLHSGVGRSWEIGGLAEPGL